MIATLILMVAGRGIAQLITNGQIMTIYYTPYFWFGNGFILGLPVSIYIVAVVLTLAWVGVRKTSMGLFVESVGINSKSTYYSGISEKNVKLLVYTFSGFCAGVAGLILSSYVHSTDANNIGLGYELDAILAVVLGGTLMTGGRFSLLASAIGALVIWAFTISMYTFGVPAAALLAAKAVLVLVVILLYSDYTRRLMNQTFRRGKDLNMAQRTKRFLFNNAPLLIVIAIFVVAYFIAGRVYPAMQKPQVFFNLFINNASLLIVSIGMTLVILTEWDRSFGGRRDCPDDCGLSRSAQQGREPCGCHALDASDGDRIWLHVGLYHPFSQSATFYRDPDGRLFRTRYGLHHQPECGSH